MKLGIMQPYFFPYLGYWQLISAVDKYVVYDDVAFIKGGWINRNNILINGQKHVITLPLDNSSSFKNINEISLVSNKKQIEKIIKSISLAYAKAPYFNDVMPIVEKVTLNNTNISTLNYNLIIELNRYMAVNTEIILSSSLTKDNSLNGQDKVIHICKILGADNYINAIGGQELYNKEDFTKEGIELKFLKMGEIEYAQFKNEFIPNLSIIDVLMFNSKEKIKTLLNEFTLI